MPAPHVTRAKTKRVEVLLEPALYEKLKTESLANGTTMTKIIKQILIDRYTKD